MDRLQTMRVFARVIDEGGFAAAARALDLSPPAVTRMVSDLEAHLGVRLIQRTTRRLALTDAGEAYLERVRQILGELDEAEALARSETTQPRGTLRLLCGPSFSTHYLCNLVPEYQRRHPQVRIELDALQATTVDEAYDLTILVTAQPLQGSFVARPLAKSEVILCASPQYLRTMPPIRRPRDLNAHRMLLIDVAASAGRGQALRRLRGPRVDETVEQDIAPSFVSNNFEVLFAAAVAGAGVVSLPSFVAHQALRDGRLAHVLPQWHAVTLGIYAGLPSRKYLPARTRAFLELLRERLPDPQRDSWL